MSNRMPDFCYLHKTVRKKMISFHNFILFLIFSRPNDFFMCFFVIYLVYVVNLFVPAYNKAYCLFV